ncbi:MAG: pantothenate synthetase [Firmicutes bacterium]|nr:pantothenate synthetase [Bacillota bacterium]
MILCTTIEEIRRILTPALLASQSIGLVPTMGALHDGHASLIKTSSKENQITVVSIFVNPTQFAPNEDLDNYPRTFEQDIKLASASGADIIFHPTVKCLYPSDDPTWVEVTGNITKVLCGKSRPIHFRGVTTVVSKLLNIVKPTKAYFGQKDAQQLQIVKKMVRDLMFDVEIIAMPIIREKDGLALSSRNAYLLPAERKAALILSKSLNVALTAFNNGVTNPQQLANLVIDCIQCEPSAKIDYVEIYQLPDLTSCQTDLTGRNLLAIGVYIGKTRLIDNIILEEKTNAANNA